MTGRRRRSFLQDFFCAQPTSAQSPLISLHFFALHRRIAPHAQARAPTGCPRLSLCDRFCAYLSREPNALSPRVLAICNARTDWLNSDFLDGADESALQDRLIRFYEVIAEPPLHPDVISRQARLVRYGLNHLVHGVDPLPTRLERCLGPHGTYAVPGIGLSFWAAIAQATNPEQIPGWTPATEWALHRLGLLPRTTRDRSAIIYGRMMEAYRSIQTIDPSLTAAQIDDFLAHVASMRGRELASPRPATESIQNLVRQIRSRLPLRERLKSHLPNRRANRARLEAALAVQNAAELRDVLRTLGSSETPIHDEALLEWTARLWIAADPLVVLTDYERMATLLGGGPWLPAAVLHLRDPRQFPLWDDDARRGLASLDDGFDPAGPMAEAYGLFAEASFELCRRFRLHPAEISDLLEAARRESPHLRSPRLRTPQRKSARADGTASSAQHFDGFCSDTFRFLSELQQNNNRAWMDAERDRYQFMVREPLVELCEAIATGYVEPVLNKQFGWDLEIGARSGQAISSIVRNDHGRSVPYESALWITFYRRACGGKRDDAQLFVRLDAEGVAAGLKLGRNARDAGRRFRRNVQQHAESLLSALQATDARLRCRFIGDDGQAIAIESVEDVRRWAACKTLLVEHRIPHDSSIVRGDDLVGEVLLTFDRLLPAYRCAIEEEPNLAAYSTRPTFDADRFHETTYLAASWLQTATSLLALKKQMILQGVPGTGKTHVSRNLARLLTCGNEEHIRLVQFHPGYCYEEFVEGIKARTVAINGRHEVTYPVEPGVLCQFAAQAASRPAETFVLIVDEINRGNLPRVFGELLYLLEYRDQEVVLPYSRRPFRLPPNLYLIGTMNTSDRSVALVDRALRRRFSFLEMPPDVRVLASWLTAHPPTEESFGRRVVELFDELNRKLTSDLGPSYQIGHSYFMVPDLDGQKLRVVWNHHVRPVLEEHFAMRPQRLAGYDLDAILGGTRKAKVGSN